MAPVSGCLVLMCGYPSSGKSAAAAAIAAKVQASGSATTVTIIDEPGLHLHRNASYADATAVGLSVQADP
jgi:protein KTI12